MTPPLHHRSLRTLDDLSQRDVLALLETARALKRAGLAGAAQRLLRGKNVALLSDGSDAQPNAFDRAAVDLGAHVAHLRPRDSGLASGDDVPATARMLGRLYDAIECEGLDSAVVGELDRHAGVPVFDGLALPEHPTRVLADLMTMAEISGKPLPELHVCVQGPARCGHGSALLRAAELAGVGVHGAQQCTLAECGADFLYEERDGHPMLTAALARPGAADFGAACDVNQRYALQALLVNTIT